MPTNLPTYEVTDRATLVAAGLPVYLLGTWEHYATQGEWVRFGRKSGKGRKLISLLASDFEIAVQVGLMREIA